MKHQAINEFKNSQAGKTSVAFGKIPTVITFAVLIALTVATALSF